MREINLDLIFVRMCQGWRTPVVLAAAAIMFTLITLHGAQPQYRVEMTILPAPSSQVPGESSIGSLGSLFGLSNGAQPGSDYVRYQRLLTSTVVAQRMQDHYGLLQEVFSTQWDKQNHHWFAPPTLRRPFLGWLFALSHVPMWIPPDATQLSAYLEGQLSIVPSPTTDLVVISMTGTDAAFAKRIMLAANAEANDVLRDQVAKRARQQVAYLEAKMAQTTVADYRASLLSLLSSEEKTLMLTQTDAAFAAEIVDPPVASAMPVSPRPLLSLFVAGLVGVLGGFTIVIFFGPNWWRFLYTRLRVWAAAIRGLDKNSDAARQA